MFSKAALISILVAVTEARFGQEQTPVAAVQALSNRGNPGDSGTLSGQVPGVLLAGANACAKLQLADKIVETLGDFDDVIAAAAALVAAEKNFNPFAVSIPSICSDAGLPATAALQGIVPLIDPAVTGSDVENANSVKSLQTPFAAGGLSVADIVAANGFTNFTTQGSDGSTGAAPSGGAAAAAPPPAEAAPPPPAECAAVAPPAATADAAPAAVVDGVQQSTVSGLDFGLCVPTIKFEAGLNGRKDTEFTFQAIDPLVNKGQQEALNPNIITNRICDQLTNVCEANAAAKSACEDAKAKISALGTRDVTTADTWNTLLGFDGTDTNPDNAPQAGLVGHT